MSSEIANNFILNTTSIEFDKSRISYAASSRTTYTINVCICLGVAVNGY